MFDDLSAVTKSSSTPIRVNVGDSFRVGDTLIENKSGIQFAVLPFQWPHPRQKWTDQGFAEVVRDNKAGGSGNEIHFDNASFGVILPQAKTLRSLSFKFGDYGGNINLIANGQLNNSNDFSSITSMPPDIKISVNSQGPLGTVTLSGKVDSFNYPFPGQPELPDRAYLFIVGGQELWIDDLKLLE